MRLLASHASKSSERGFSLVEILVSMAISVLVMTIAISWFLYQGSLLSLVKLRTEAESTALLTAFQLERWWSPAGGGAIPVWAAVLPENNCTARGDLPDCDGSDRLNIATLDTKETECMLENYDPSSGTLKSKDIIDTSSATPVDVCCLSGNFTGRPVYLSSSPSFRAVYIRSVDTSTCTATTETIKQTTFEFSSGAFPTLTNGTISPIHVGTYFLDRTNQYLCRWSDTNNDGHLDANELILISPEIIDMQISVGYDVNSDGQIADTQSTADEWLYNAAGDAIGSGGLSTATPQHLKRLGVSVISGTAKQTGMASTNSKIIRLDGPVRSLNLIQSYGSYQTILFHNLILDRF